MKAASIFLDSDFRNFFLNPLSSTFSIDSFFRIYAYLTWFSFRSTTASLSCSNMGLDTSICTHLYHLSFFVIFLVISCLPKSWITPFSSFTAHPFSMNRAMQLLKVPLLIWRPFLYSHLPR